MQDLVSHVAAAIQQGGVQMHNNTNQAASSQNPSHLGNRQLSSNFGGQPQALLLILSNYCFMAMDTDIEQTSARVSIQVAY
eukprot:1393127-Rhodomonas_salina.2